MDLNEHRSDNLTVVLPPLQQVNSERKPDLNNDLNGISSNNHVVVDPAPQQDLNEDQNEADPDQQSTSVCRCGFKTNFSMKFLKACNTDGCRKSYMDLGITSRRRR